MGSFLGDALGGPVEFQTAEDLQRLDQPPHRWRSDEVLDEGSRAAARDRLLLRGYDPLRPEPEPYGHWSRHAPPGTVTDDSRHKMILIDALRRAEAEGSAPLDAKALARTYLDWPDAGLAECHPESFHELNREWLHEWNLASRWILGDRNPETSRPPERLWGGLPTCCGQMVFLPIAAVYGGSPAMAYRHTHDLAFFDNGPALDLNASLVAGLAATLAEPMETPRSAHSWSSFLDTLRSVDPYGYESVPWVERPTHQWLNYVEGVINEADGYPARVFAQFDRDFDRSIKWEAQVCFCVAMAALLLAETDPLAALQLSLEWGHDTDSYAQIVGACIGARYGEQVFPAEMRATLTNRVRQEYGFELEREADWLADLGMQSKP